MQIPKQQMKRTSIPSHLWSSVSGSCSKTTVWLARHETAETDSETPEARHVW